VRELITYKGMDLNFSKNFYFFKRILSIPSLKKLNIIENTLGDNEFTYLCEFIKENKTLEELAFTCKKKEIIILRCFLK
jgi:hypothetical protein